MFAWILRWPRHAALCGGVVLALLAYGAWSTWRIVSARPVLTFDGVGRMNALARSAQSRGQNGWPILRQAMIEDLMVSTPRSPGGAQWAALGTFLTANQLRHGAWDETDRTADLNALASFATVLEAMDLAASHPAFFKPYVHEGDALTGEKDESKRVMAYSVLLPELTALFQLSRLNAIAMRVAGATGDWDELERRVDAGLWLGIGLMRQATLLEISVGCGVAEQTLMELAILLNDEALPVEVSNRLVRLIDDLQWTAAATKSRMIDSIDLMMNDMIQWTFTDNGRGNGLFTWDDQFGIVTARTAMRAPVPMPHTSLRLFGLFAKDRRQTLREWEEIKSELIEKAHDTQWVSPSRSSDRMTTWRRSLKSRSFVIEAGLPHPFSSFHHVDHLESHLRGVRAMLLLEAANHESNEWPESLAQVLDESDFIDPVSGRAFFYERTPDDADGRPYIMEIPWRYAPIDPNARLNPARRPLTSRLMGID